VELHPGGDGVGEVEADDGVAVLQEHLGGGESDTGGGSGEYDDAVGHESSISM
jgi:hypothetical protein